MVERLRGLQGKCTGLLGALRRIRSREVNSASDRQSARGLVDVYFSDTRPVLRACGMPDDRLAPLDVLMQGLLRKAQRKTRRTVYVELVGKIAREVNELEIDAAVRASLPATTADAVMPEQDRRIVGTLQGLCPSAAASYSQGMRDLGGPERLSWRGPATEFREALRQTVDLLAPDDKLAVEPGFQLEPKMTRPSLRQKARFILKSRRRPGRAIDATTEAIGIVDEKVAAFVPTVYGQASQSLHGQSSREEVRSIRNFVRTVLAEILEIGD
jgi:hypothetical protein